MAKKKRSLAQQQGEKRSSGLVITLLGVVFLGFMSSQWHERQVVTAITVEGASGLSQRAVELAVDTLLHRKIKNITLADVRDCVQGLPYVRSAAVCFSGVRNVSVVVDERIPVAHIVGADGTLNYVDATGTILPSADTRTAHNVPVLQSKNGSRLKADEISKIVAILVAGAGTLEPVLYQSISEVRFDQRMQTLDVVTDETTWRMGKMNVRAASQAFADMNVFWVQAASRLTASRIAEVDLRWKHQIVIRYAQAARGQAV